MLNNDLFDNDAETPKIGRGGEIKWRLVTNHLNMMFMLSAGMIIPPTAFGKKYYLDTLSFVPGWIPLFPEKLSQLAIQHSVSEQAHLKPCYIEFNLKETRGPVKLLKFGRWVDANFPDDVMGDEEVMLIPAPLPVSLITEIVFSSKEDKTYCEKDAKNFFNVPLADYVTKASSTPFKKFNSGSWWFYKDGLNEHQIDLTIADAFGGVIALLSQLSNQDDTAIAVSKAFNVAAPDEALINSFSMLFGAHQIFYPLTQDTELAGASGVLFKELAQAIINHRTSLKSGSSKDVVMAVLENSNDRQQGVARQAGERLIEDLKHIVQLPDKTLDELLQLHQKPLPRSLILFFMCNSAEDLLELRSNQLTGYELCGAAILLGISEGWMRMPAVVRARNGLNIKVPAFMANLSLKRSNTAFSFGKLPERPRSLRDLFLQFPFDKTTNQAALFIARTCKWPCIKTRIKLGKGDYQLSIDGSGVSLVLDGDVKAVEAEIDHEHFLKSLSAAKDMPQKVEHETRKILEK
jgi:hypothetical protein